MRCEAELSFLCDVMAKNHIDACIAEQSKWDTALQNWRGSAFFDAGTAMRRVFPSMKNRVSYRLTDSFGCHYRFLLLSDTEEPTVLLIGPFLSAPLDEQRLLELGEKNGISPHRQSRLAEYCAALPVLETDSPLFTLWDAFCERLWDGPLYEVLDVSKQYSATDPPFSRSMTEKGEGDALVSMRAMENRYAFENEMMRCVAAGRTLPDAKLQSTFAAHAFEKRTSDPIRDAKNYAIIMNTLLRKAAEKGGVHPVYLDRTSSEFATRIESFRALQEITDLMREMLDTYCRLVRKHSLKRMSTVVRQTVMLIDSDLSVDLSPRVLAQKQGVSLGYLSTVFHKETGKTLSAYVRERRMEYAAYLLRTTGLQIQTVALHCGIVDVQYFSKLFKKEQGRSPSEYRALAEGAPLPL